MDRQKDIATQSIDDIRETISKEVDAQECLGAETEPASGLGSEGVLSKRQQKKLLKRQHVEERREQVRTVKKAARAENKSAAAAAVGPGGAPPPPVPSEEQLAKKALRRERRLDAKREFLDKAAFHVVLDCCFDHLMESPEICSMAHQLNEVYAVSRRMADREPFHLHITDMTEGGGGSKTRKELEYQRPNLQDWTATLHPDGLEQVLARVASAQEASGKGRGKVIYLTADTENKLEEIERDATYIIGGIVDRNRHKGLCAERAEKLGIATARLPLQEHVRLKSSVVLTTNHVADLLASRFEMGSWSAAVRAVIPGRKVKEFLNADGSTEPGPSAGEDS